MKKPSGPRNASSMQNLVDAVAIDQLAKIIARYDLSDSKSALASCDCAWRVSGLRWPTILA